MQPWVCVKHDASGYNESGRCPTCANPPPPWPPVVLGSPSADDIEDDYRRSRDLAAAAERAAIVRWLIIQSSDYLPLCNAIRNGEHLKG
jgi:hypothetical protein